MSKQTPVSNPIFSLLPADVEGFDSLAELALDIRWSWNHATDEDERHVYEVRVYLHDLDPKAVRVELYADGVMGGAPERQEMKCVRQPAGASGGCVYRVARVCGPATTRLYGTSGAAPQWRIGSSGRCAYPVATVTTPSAA